MEALPNEMAVAVACGLDPSSQLTAVQGGLFRGVLTPESLSDELDGRVAAVDVDGVIGVGPWLRFWGTSPPLEKLIDAIRKADFSYEDLAAMLDELEVDPSAVFSIAFARPHVEIKTGPVPPVYHPKNRDLVVHYAVEHGGKLDEKIAINYIKFPNIHEVPESRIKTVHLLLNSGLEATSDLLQAALQNSPSTTELKVALLLIEYEARGDFASLIAQKKQSAVHIHDYRRFPHDPLLNQTSKEMLDLLNQIEGAL